VLARQVLYHLSHTLGLFCFSYFLDRVLHFCQRPAWDGNPFTICAAGIVGESHHAQPLSSLTNVCYLYGQYFK
jgi:hypothetical protein